MSAAPRKLTRIDAAIAIALFVFYLIILVKSVGTLGYARDEGFYFHAASSYGAWLERLWASPGAAIERRAVDAAWGVNHEHPALIKTLFALSNLLLQKRLHLFAMEGTSYRFPAMALAGGLISLVYVWGAQARSRAAGLVAAALLAAMPRFFYHAHLACFDAPIVALWTLCAYSYWRSGCAPDEEARATSGDRGRAGGARPARRWLWPVATGVTFGLAFCAKHNSWFLPIVAGAHTAATLAASRLLPDAGARAAAAARGKRGAAALAAMAVLGPLLLVALWPWLWRDTLPRFIEYAKFHLHHDYYNMEFLGRTYWTPPMPRAYAFVMTAATVPLITLLLFAAGLAGRLRLRLAEAAHLWIARTRARGAVPPWLARIGAALGARPLGSRQARLGPGAGTELLWLLSIGAIYAAWLSPGTPIFGGTKHWMTAYPFLALFAGLGFDDLLRAARAQAVRWRRRLPRAALAHSLLAALLGAAVLASPLVQTARSHPWGLSSYTPLVGGAAGAATLGLNRTFWGYTTGAVTGYLNDAPRNATVFIHDTAGQSWDMLLADGRLRKDLRGVWSVDGSTFGLYHHEQHMGGIEYQSWVAYGTTRPDHVAGLDGVPVIWVYRRPGK
jgi:4-amino-4-deoxy-L-arabinose transferase-like glycosyltransferase